MPTKLLRNIKLRRFDCIYIKTSSFSSSRVVDNDLQFYFIWKGLLVESDSNPKDIELSMFVKQYLYLWIHMIYLVMSDKYNLKHEMKSR